MTRPRTPLWVRATLIAVLVGVPVWLLVLHLERTANQRRLSAIATQIAGRPVHVHCPGVFGRLTARYDLAEGTVQFDAQGRPADTTYLRTYACAELDALAEGRRQAVLDCLCGEPARDLAMAVDTLTHESFHLSGIAAEGETECRSLDRMDWTAQQLGATPAQAAALAHIQRTETYPRMPDLYHARCRAPA